jgi:DNA mismatch endonuclease (patch repair protein)
MVDVLTPEQRRLNMSRIRGRDTKPELLLRRGLHARGLRFRLHRKDLPGCPDLIFPRFRAVVFVHGCFWHRHACPMFKVPETRREFWLKKISQNVKRDRKAVVALQHEGWRVLTVWECALRGKRRLHLEIVLKKAESFLTGNRRELQVEGAECFDGGRQVSGGKTRRGIHQAAG